MAFLLHIETSVPYASIALTSDGALLSEKFTGHNKASEIPGLIRESLEETKRKIKDLDALSLSAGPGSYTGLRVGAGLAKGVCHARNIPLIAIPTLWSMASFLIQEVDDKEALFCPLIDARRMEVYTALYDAHGRELLKQRPLVMEENPLAAYLERRIHFFGSGLEKCIPVLSHARAVFHREFKQHAAHLVVPAELAFSQKDFVDFVSFEPEYLKPVHIIPSHK